MTDSVERPVRAGVSLGHALSGACDLIDRGSSGAVVGGGQVLVSFVRRSVPARLALGHSLSELRRGLTDERTVGGPVADEPVADGPAGAWASDLDLEVDGALREVRWARFSLDVSRRVASGSAVPRFGGEVRDALRRSLVRAGTEGVRWVGATYLLDEVLADPGGTAHQLLLRCGVEPARLLDAVHAEDRSKDDEPPTPMVDTLRWYGSGSSGRLARALGRLFKAGVTRAAGTGISAQTLELEATGRAVWLGHPTVTTAHLLLAVAALDEQVALAERARPDRSVPAGLLAANRGGAVLTANGVTYPAALRIVATSADLDEALPPATDGPPAPRSGHGGGDPAPGTGPLGPAWSASALAARADLRAAYRSSGDSVGSTHLLAAALTQPDAAAQRLLRGLGADPAAVAAGARRLLTPA
jgi:hypothetical protein